MKQILSKIGKVFIKKTITAKKSNQSTNTRQPRMAFADYLLSRREYKLAAYEAVNLYLKCVPAYDAIDRIATAVSSIIPRVYDDQKDIFITDHPLSILFKQPNYGVTYADFCRMLTSFLLITGDSYIIANSTGLNSTPRVLSIIPPQLVNIIVDSDGYVKSYNVNYYNSKFVIYNRNKTIDGDKYISEINGIISELYHIKNFNPNDYYFNIKGLSPLTPAFYEIEQYCATSIHNLSLLKRGTTLDGVFLIDRVLSAGELDTLRSHINEYYSGEDSAGRPFIIDNANGVRHEAKKSSRKDMDFEALKDQVSAAIYNALKIPAPKINTETMTLANLEASQEVFYDDAVIPWLERILDHLTMFLLPKYSGSENLKIWYDQSKIFSLQTRNINNLRRLNQINAITTNEMRSKLGYKPIDDGADVLYQSQTLLPYTSEIKK